MQEPEKRKRQRVITLARGAVLALVFLGLMPQKQVEVADPPRPTPTDVVVICHPKGVDEVIEKKTISRIYSGKYSIWERAKKKGKVTFFVLREGEIHKAFLAKYAGKTPSRFRRYWKRLVFTGKAKAPRSFKREAEMVKAVVKTPGAIGYVSAAVAKRAGAKVKVLKFD